MKILLLAIFLFVFMLASAGIEPDLNAGPEGFTENRGQVVDQHFKPNASVLYLLKTPGMNVQIRKGGFSYDLYRISNIEQGMSNVEVDPHHSQLTTHNSPLTTHNSPLTIHHSPLTTHPSPFTHFHRIDFDFAGSNPRCEIITPEPDNGSLNFYTAGTPETGVLNVRSFQSVIYQNLYPGIDLEFMTSEGSGLKYNLLIHPGAQLEKVRMKISGAEITVSPTGSLLMSTSLGTVEETIPRSNITAGGVESAVRVRFTDLGNGTWGLISDDPVPPGATLVVDPVPDRLWGSYLGGTDADGAFAGTIDLQGCTYFAGRTQSPAGIATAGAHQVVLAGLTDGFVAKFSPEGQRIWATYYGGDNNDLFRGITITPDDHLVVSGVTSSGSGISTAGAFQQGYGGGPSDACLVKFDSAGVRIWGTYYGGSSDDIGFGVDRDLQGNIYLSGETKSADNIATPGCHQPVPGLMVDLFLVKFTPAGNRVWGTYYGGECNEFAGTTGGCAADDDNAVYLCGSTCSLTAMATAGAFQAGIAGGADGFLAKFDTAGVRQWGTYYGGPMDDRISHVRSTTAHRIAIAGETQSLTGIASAGSYQVTYGGGFSDAFLGRFLPGGLPHWVTYYGGESEDAAHFSDTEDNGNIFFCGYTKSLSAIATAGVFQPAFGGGTFDGMLLKFDSSGNRIWGTYYGGEGNDWIYSVDHLAGGSIYLSGITSSLTNVATAGSHQNVFGGGIWDALVVKLTECTPPGAAGAIAGPAEVCIPGEGVSYSIPAVPQATGYTWHIPPGSTVTSGNNTNAVTLSFPAGSSAGTISVKATNSCGTGDSAFMPVAVFPRPEPALTGTDSACEGETLQYFTQSGQAVYAWQRSPGAVLVAGGSPADTSVTILWNTPGAQWVKVSTTDVHGCTSMDTARVDVAVSTLAPVGISVTPPAGSVCSGTLVTFTAVPVNGGTAPAYQWKVNAIPAGTNDPVFTYPPANGDVVTCVLTSDALCASGNPATSAPVVMSVNPLLPVGVTIAASGNPVCGGVAVTFTATPSNPGNSPIYQWKVNAVNVGSNAAAYTFTPANGDVVTCQLTSNIACPLVNPVLSNPVTMQVFAPPAVTFTPCFDTITRVNAKPFKLKGGIPLGGIYSGPGVNSSTGIFIPSAAGTGTKTITYTYTNAALCSDVRSAIVDVRPLVPFTCGTDLTDIRDGKKYATIQIGSQCWMAANLNFGTMISGSIHQRDNCITEKYCYNDFGANCAAQGGIYQWDEMMRFEDVPGQQGICPPAWHVPTEAEWNQLFASWTNNGFAGSPLKYSGYSGFNALLSGTGHLNRQWDFMGFATFFWSSTPYTTAKAWAHGMNEENPSVSQYPSLKSNAFSIRCLRD